MKTTQSRKGAKAQSLRRGQKRKAAKAQSLRRGHNAKPQRRKAAKAEKKIFFFLLFAPLRLCGFALVQRERF
jgi:hypothetical protein